MLQVVFAVLEEEAVRVEHAPRPVPQPAAASSRPPVPAAPAAAAPPAGPGRFRQLFGGFSWPPFLALGARRLPLGSQVQARPPLGKQAAQQKKQPPPEGRDIVVTGNLLHQIPIGHVVLNFS